MKHATTILSIALLVAGCSGSTSSTKTPSSPLIPKNAITTVEQVRGANPPKPADVLIAAGPEVARPPFNFNAEDEQFLSDVEHGAFNFMWNVVSDKSGMVVDRTSAKARNFVSVGGVGFQLPAICIGVDRGFITRAQGEERCLSILRTLRDNPKNRKFGMLYHYLDGSTGGQPKDSWEYAAGSVDAALFYAGAITAGMYFGGEVRQIADQLYAECDWSKFYITDINTPMGKGRKMEPYDLNKFSLAWTPNDKNNPTGDGVFHPYFWLDSGSEHRLVAFLGVCATKPEHRTPPESYYNLRRMVGVYDGLQPMVYLPYSGATFIQFFSNCWIDYGSIGPDNPSAFGVDRRARVDWWENSRRHVEMHRKYALDNPKGLPTLGVDAWGLTACDIKGGYGVPGVNPEHVTLPGERANFDYATEDVRIEPGDGTLAPYGSGSCIMFEPKAALASLKYYRSLKAGDGSPLLWRDPVSGGFGFQDSFNLGKNFVAEDCLAIDQGPLIIAIENARTGLIWKLFHSHPAIQEGMKRLGLSRATSK
jgi:hypothetical protein